MDSRNTIIAIVALLVLGFAAWAIFADDTPPATNEVAPPPAALPATTTTPVRTAAPTPAAPVKPAPKAVTVVYSDSGFSPATISVPVGSTVTFVNQSSEKMWVASAKHPTHQSYDGTTKVDHCADAYKGAKPFDECVGAESGSAWSFTFNQVGAWEYHDHINASMHGTVAVTR